MTRYQQLHRCVGDPTLLKGGSTMLLTKAHVQNYKSIDDAGPVEIEPKITVLVGQNESGKTAFLEALHKARSIEEAVKYEVVEDYPRKNLSVYEPTHAADPALVAELHYEVGGDVGAKVNEGLGVTLLDGLIFSVAHHMDNSADIHIDIDEAPFVKHTVASSSLPAEVKKSAEAATSMRELLATLDQLDLDEEGTALVASLRARFPDAPEGWGLVEHQVWKAYIEPAIPRFVYFDEYKLLPAKVNLEELQRRRQAEDGRQLNDGDRTVLGLLSLANIDLSTLIEEGGYEKAKARLEGISNRISDQVFQYWTQNQREGVPELEVHFDIKADPKDVPPFNQGKNLYVRIRSLRHRVSVPFDKRSRGFIWFFSFLVWFDSIKQQVNSKRDLVLLLDEPGLSLHALAQDDLLRYVDDLARRHQVLYTTPSPFMVRREHLGQVRLVVDRLREGTVVTDVEKDSDDKTLFPLQAALGYSVAQNLFIAKKNLLVEGPADLIYLQFFSNLLQADGRTGLADEIVIVPVGGLDKLATFVALLGANQLDLVVVHDWAKSPEQKLNDLVQKKVIRDRQVLHYGMFRTGKKAKNDTKPPATDVEDFFTDALYLQLFNAAYSRELGNKQLAANDLAKGDRIVERIERTLANKGITVRPSGGYNHYRPSAQLASHPPARSKIPDTVLSRFEALFAEVNRCFA